MTIKALVFDAYGTLYDIQSVAATTEEEFPGYGEIITQIWRIKQLEYSWLRSLMRRYEDFSIITRDSLAYTLRCLGLKHDPAVLDRIMEKYLHLDLYPDAKATLVATKDRKLAILSNGSTDMLNTLVRNTGLDRVLDATISIDSKRVFKPSPETYTLIEANLGIPPAEQDRIFEKFFRLDPNLTRGVGGTGLGLYISRELVLRMNGRIWVDSDGRTGSSFFLELPVA